MARKVDGLGINDNGFCKLGSDGLEGWYSSNPGEGDSVPENFTNGMSSNMWGGLKGVFDQDTFPIAGCIPSLANIGSKTPKMLPPFGEYMPFLPGMLSALGAMLVIGAAGSAAQGKLEEKE